MTIFNFIEMLGGLALFLYGMQVLGEGLKSSASGRMEQLLEKLTNNKWKAALLGAGVTAVIQSSGATVVMVVGLVNSGIMSLEQSVGVTIGANVGTTVTAWLLSLTMISGDNLLVSLIKPENFAPILALIAVALLMVAKKDYVRHAATILVGFSVLMIGMTTMSGAFSGLADDPKFTGIMTAFAEKPAVGLLAGLIVTIILQSSSASIGVLQSMSMSGSLTVGGMLPALMGANIGSAVTGLIGAIGSNRSARRAAWLQMFYCILKAGVFMLIFYPVNALVHFGFMSNPIDPIGIAIIHTLFNVAALLVFLPGSDILVAVVNHFIPVLPEEKSDVKAIPILDEHFFSSPSFALEQAQTATNDMAQYAKEALEISMDLIWNFSEEKAKEVDRLERTVDSYEDQLESYLVKLSQKTMTNRDSHTLSILLHSINDFERITDHALNVQQAAVSLHEKKLGFSARARQEMLIYADAVRSIMNMTVLAFQNSDLGLAKQVEPLEEVIDGLDMEENRRHVRRLRKGKCNIEAGFILSDITTDYERIADHCSNVAVALLQVNEDGFDTHEYLEREERNNSEEFRAEVRKFEEKYRFPALKKDDEIRTIESEEAVKISENNQKSGKDSKSSKLSAAGKPAKEEKDGKGGKSGKDTGKNTGKNSGKDAGKDAGKNAKSNKSMKSVSSSASDGGAGDRVLTPEESADKARKKAEEEAAKAARKAEKKAAKKDKADRRAQEESLKAAAKAAGIPADEIMAEEPGHDPL